MQRRKMLAALGSVAVGGATAMSTGAFTSVSANRSVEVKVADDDSAFLSVTGNDTPNGNEYVQDDGTQGPVSLDFSEVTGGDGVDSSGLNDDAVTIIRDVLTIENQGTQRVLVRISGMPEGMSAYEDDFDGVEDEYGPFGITLNANAKTSKLPRLDPGDSLDEVGFKFKTGDQNSGDDPLAGLENGGDITIQALTNEEAGAPDDEVGSG